MPIPTLPKLRIESLSGLLVASGYFLVMFLYYPFRERFEFDLDEGLEAMKSMLLARGYPLYTQIWSDQPPFMTYLLAISFRLFGFEVNVGRLLILILASALLGSACYLLYRVWGPGHALAGVLLIFLLPFFTQLSVSIMFGLPAVAFATLALTALLFWHRERKPIWLALSGITLALSLLTKLFTGFLAPVFLIGLILPDGNHPAPSPNRWTWLKPAFTWGLWFGGAVLGLGLLMVGPGNIPQLLNTHLLARGMERYTAFPGTYTITQYIFQTWPLLALALIGLALSWRRQRLFAFYSAAWALIAYGLLFFHQPVWYHHTLLVTVPLALLAGAAAGEGLAHTLQLLRRAAVLSRFTLLALLALAGFALILRTRLPQVLPDLQRPPFFVTGAAHAPWQEQMFLVKMSNHAADTDWVLTNLPMYAFRVGLPVPPFLGAMSEKRISTGQLSEADIISVLEEYQPEQVLLGRREFPALEQILERDYKLLYERGKRMLFVRKDLKL